ncbi:hypothetical protein AN391_02158 [Pseudoalteromonas sp. P1-13-1a]|nr:hypothetical protein AN391_02158 [Pseudoalteromonas sp. P1-13-1a]KPZ62345.1 hypothetical protein AN389_00797 [Pseudoalteromonas sp. P1-7a]
MVSAFLYCNFKKTALKSAVKFKSCALKVPHIIEGIIAASLLIARNYAGHRSNLEPSKGCVGTFRLWCYLR